MTQYRHDIDIWVTEASVAKYPEDKYPDLYFDPPDEEGDLCSCAVTLKHQYEPLAEVIARTGIDPADIVMIQKVWGEIDEDGDVEELDAEPRVFFKESWAEYYLWFKKDGDHVLDIQLKPGSEQLLEQLGYERFDQGKLLDIPYGKYEVNPETGICTISHEWPDWMELNKDWTDWSNPESGTLLCKVLRIPPDAIHATYMNG